MLSTASNLLASSASPRNVNLKQPSRTQIQRTRPKECQPRERFCLECGIKIGLYRHIPDAPILVVSRLDDFPYGKPKFLSYCDVCEAFRECECDGKFVDYCLDCCASDRIEQAYRRTYQIACNTCRSSMRVRAALSYWDCDKCGESMCPECSALCTDRRWTCCSRTCFKANRKARLEADKRARWPWKHQESSRTAALDVLEVEVENALELLGL